MRPSRVRFRLLLYIYVLDRCLP